MKEKINRFFNVFSPKNKKFGYNFILSAIAFLILGVASIILGIMGLYFSAAQYETELFNFYLENERLVALNILPYIIITYFVWFISNRPWIAYFCSGTICLVYSLCNYWKLVGRDDPLFAEDLTLIGEALKMTEEGYAEFTPEIIAAIGLFVFTCIFLALFIRGRMFHFSFRIIMPCLIIALCVPLYTNVYTSYGVYHSFSQWDGLNPWFVTTSYISRGGIYPFIHSIPDALPQKPEDYTETEAEEILEEYDDDVIPEEKRANVMFVMYEAFSDLSKYTDKLTARDPYKTFHKLQSESYSGELVTNIFAGGTINSEQTAITGFSDAPTFRKSSWSYARYFADMGYTVNGSHAGYKSFYNRVNANRHLGFQNYNFIENYFSDICDGIPMDDVFIPEITKLFKEDISEGKNVFSFNVTYQNHGPYNTHPNPDSREYVTRKNVAGENYAITNNYLTGVEETGEYMLSMADEFRNSPEPVILVFFGDHKPWLGDSSVTYEALGIDIFSKDKNSFYNRYNTEYLIWANNAAKKLLNNDFVGEGPMISPCFLMNVLFKECGWEGPSYLKLSNTVMAKMPVVTTNDRVLQHGSLLQEKMLDYRNRNLLLKFRKAQYYLSHDFKN